MSYGDDIMTTGYVRKIKSQFPKSRILIGDGKKEYLSSVFWHNPNIDHAIFLKKSDHVIWVKDYPGHRSYIDYSRSDKDHFAFRKFTPLKGDLYFTPKEIAEAKQVARRFGKFVVIEPNVRGLFAACNRDWGFQKWQVIVNHLRDRLVFVQLGRTRTRQLKGVHRIMTRTFRDACAILSFASLFVGTEGGLHHAAAALDIDGVVVFGGRCSPRTFGYSDHSNLYVKHPASPCGRTSPCVHCRQCMDQISVNDVIKAISKRL